MGQAAPGRPAAAEDDDHQPLMAAAAAATPSAGAATTREPSRGTGSDGAGGEADATAAATSTAADLPPPPACRICLQEEDAGALEQHICSCTGSMQWAHRDCIQRWIDEKHDKTCEICGQPFRGPFRDPPPRPPPVTSAGAGPLVAQLHIDEATDRRILLMRDPETGEVVARVLVPEDGRGGSSDGQEDSSEEESSEDGDGRRAGGGGRRRRRRAPASLALPVLLVFCVVGFFAWVGGAGTEGGEEASGALAASWVARIVMLTAWIFLRSLHRAMPRSLITRHAAIELDQRHSLAALAGREPDIESGQQLRR